MISNNLLSSIIKKIINYLYKKKFLFFIIAIPVKLFDILFIKKRNRILFYGYKGRYSGNSASLFRYCLSNESKFEPIWLLDKRDVESFDGHGNYFLLPNKNSSLLNHIKLFLKVASANVIVVSSVGDLSIYCSLLYSKKRLEILLPQGITIKSGGVMSKHLNSQQKEIWKIHSKRFDIISATSRLEQYRISSSLNLSPEKIKILGVQRAEFNSDKSDDNEIDRYFEEIFDKLDKNYKDLNFFKATKVLYAPTHRDHLNLNYKNTLLEKIDGFNLDELNLFLKNENIILFLREHAESVTKTYAKNLHLKSNIINLNTEDFPDIEKYLKFIDIIITDYSGIFIEHLKSKKAFAFALFDFEEYESDRGLTLPKDILYPGYIFRSQDKLIYYLKNKDIINSRYENHKKYLYSLFFEKSSEGSCKRTMEEIYKLI